MPRLCKDCPAWTNDVKDDKGNPAIADGQSIGRCRAALPTFVTQHGNPVSAFPTTLEEQWCYPGQFISENHIRKA